MPDHRETLQQLWLKHARGIGVEQPSMPLLSHLVSAWGEPHRYYHSLRHLQECLQTLERWGKDTTARHEVGIALWFHDGVYDPRRGDNEDRSARWAVRALKEVGVAEGAVRRIGKLIRATKHLSPSAEARATGVDGLDLMLDIDLAILGADRARFEEYERQVRLEYAHVLTFTSLVSDGSQIRIRAPLALDVETSPGVLERVNGLNASISRYVRFAFGDGTIVLAAEVPLVPFVPEHLAVVFREVCRVGDFMSDLLCAEFSGRNLFGTRMTSTLVH